MAQYTTDALVLGTRNWGDADKIVTLFSREHGQIRAAAFGCRRPKSTLSAAMQIFNHLEVRLTEGRHLDTVRQAELRQNFPVLQENLNAMAYGTFLAEMVQELFLEREPFPAVFDRLLLILAAFSLRSPRLTVLAGGYQLLEFTGSQLHYDVCVHCGQPLEGAGFFSFAEGGALCSSCGRVGQDEPFSLELRQFVVQLLTLDWQKPPALHVRARELLAAESLLLRYLRELLGKPLRSLTFIQQLAQMN